jgi:multidrug efflux pump subunit AcrA (membrane-fusion protein)
MSDGFATAASPSPDLFALGRAAQAASRAATGGCGFFACSTFIATSIPMLIEATGRGLRGLLRLSLTAGETVPQQEQRLAQLAAQVREGLVLDGVVPTPGDDCLGLATLLFVARCRLTLTGVPHVLVDLNRLGPKLGQLALGFGADELCGTIVEKRALRLGDNAGSRVLTRAEAAQLLRGAGLRAFERVAGGGLEEFTP